MSGEHGTTLAVGLRFTEGPSVDFEGTLFFSEIPIGRINRLLPDGDVEVFLELSAPNGTAFHPNGDLYFCERDLRLIGVADASGRWHAIVDGFEGGPLLGPNDCTFDYSGNLYFSDPFGSSLERPIGSVYRVDPSRQIACVATGLAFPNGLAVNADDSVLFVAETYRRRILRIELYPDGSFGSPDIFCELDPVGLGPDGMDFDIDGNLLVAHFKAGHIDVFEPGGDVVHRIFTPGERVSNLEFRGTTLYVTVTEGEGDNENGKLVRYDWKVPGLPTYAETGPPTTE